MHNCIPHFDRAGQHWTQMYHRLPVSSAVDNSARAGVVERLRRTLRTRMLMYKVMYIVYFSWKLHCSFVSAKHITMDWTVRFLSAITMHIYVVYIYRLSMSPHVAVLSLVLSCLLLQLHPCPMGCNHGCMHHMYFMLIFYLKIKC